MNIDRAVLAFAGAMILISLAIGYFVSPTAGVVLLAFIGLNLFQSAFTGFCPLAIILKKLGFQSGQAFN
jgi:hypothetical protein